MIVIILVGLAILITINVLTLLLVRNISLSFNATLAAEKGSTVFKKETKESDPFIDDLMHYAFQRGIQPLAMPGQDGKNTLFDSTKDGIISVCEIFTTEHKKGTKGYNDLLQRIKDQIDFYYENKILIREKAKESVKESVKESEKESSEKEAEKSVKDK
jgi:hypothetical protein